MPHTPVTDEQIRRHLGPALRDARKASRLKLREVAAATGLSIGYLSQIELGNNTPSLPALFAYAAATGASVPALLARVADGLGGTPEMDRGYEL